MFSSSGGSGWFNIITFCIFLALVLPQLLTPIMPVVALMTRTSDIYYEDGKLGFTVSGLKIRNCDYIGGTEEGFAKYNGVWEEDIVPFLYPEDKSEGSSKPPRVLSDFGVFEWEVDEIPEKVMVRVRHLCPEGTVITHIYFDVREMYIE